MRSSHFPNPLSRVIFEGEATLKCCVASAEIIAFNSDEEYIKMQNTTEVIIDCSAKPKNSKKQLAGIRSLRVEDSDFFFVPRSFHVDKFTFHICK